MEATLKSAVAKHEDELQAHGQNLKTLETELATMATKDMLRCLEAEVRTKADTPEMQKVQQHLSEMQASLTTVAGSQEVKELKANLHGIEKHSKLLVSLEGGYRAMGALIKSRLLEIVLFISLPSTHVLRDTLRVSEDQSFFFSFTSV